MRILGPPTASWDTVRANLIKLGAAALFVDQIAPAVWTAARRHCVDPVGAIAQAFKETGGGRFGGRVKPEFYNPCGLKLRHPGLFPETSGDQPLAHSQFASWLVGCEAFVQHLLAYTGCLVEDAGYLVVDPRVVFVLGNNYRVETFEELSGKWAPSTRYGTEIIAIANQLMAEA